MDLRAQYSEIESQLRRILDERLDKPELRTFCFDLDVEYDNLSGDTKIEKATGLVGHLARRRRLSDLVGLGQKQRPGIPWPSKEHIEDLEQRIKAQTPDHPTPPPLPDPDTLPDPGPLPPGSRLPFQRNAVFTGRVEPLKALARALIHGESASTLVTQAVHGMGGIGKTQLAVEFAHRYGRYFCSVHWLNAALPEGIAAQVALCGQAMNLTNWPQEQPQQVAHSIAIAAATAVPLIPKCKIAIRKCAMS